MTDDKDKLEEIYDFEDTPILVWDVIFFLVFFIFILFPYVTFGSEKEVQRIMLKVSAEATVTDDVIRLGDISEIAAPDSLKNEISGLVVSPSPRPGRSKNIIRSRISNLIKTSFKGGIDAEIDAPEIVVVSRDFQKVSEEELKSLLNNRVRDITVSKTADVSDFMIRGKNLFPSGQMDLKPAYDSQGIRMGRICIPVDVYVSGKKEGRLTLSAKVGVFTKILCAARDIPKGTLITEEDLKLDSRQIGTGVSGGILTELGSAVGKKVKSSIRANNVIPEKLLEAPSVLKKGDRVRLVAKSGILSVETMAEASSDAALGESVMVKNLDSGKLVSARVVDSSTVEVVF